MTHHSHHSDMAAIVALANITPNPAFNSVTVTSALIGSSDPLHPTKLEGDWDFSAAVFIPPFGGGGSEPLPFATQIVQVNKAGSDVTGNGTDEKPYLTVSFAMSTITDALYEKRYVICVGPGEYNENITLKAWVFVNGAGNQATRFNGTIDINDPSWAVPGTHSDERGGFVNCVFRGPSPTFDFTAAPSLYGKVYLRNVDSNNAINFIGYHPVNQGIIFGGGGLFFGGINNQGVTVLADSVSFQGNTISSVSSPNANTVTVLTGCVQVGNLSNVYTASANTVQTYLYESYVEGLVTVSGANASLFATCGSLPPRANVSVTGGAVLNLLNDAAGMAYTPTTPANWPLPVPTTVQQALDDLSAAAVSHLVSVDPAVTAHTGGGQALAYPITKYFTNVTTVALNSDSVVLPASVVGTVAVVKNNGINLLAIYPPLGSGINALPHNTQITLGSGLSAEIICTTTTNWQQIT